MTTERAEKVVKNIAIPGELAALADAEAEKLNLSFTAFISLLLGNYFKTVKFEGGNGDSPKS